MLEIKHESGPLTLNLLKFLNGIHCSQSSIFGTVHYHFQGYQDDNIKLVSQEYRAWSDCMNVQAGLALYWWKRLITVSSSRIRANKNIPLNHPPTSSTVLKLVQPHIASKNRIQLIWI